MEESRASITCSATDRQGSVAWCNRKHSGSHCCSVAWCGQKHTGALLLSYTLNNNGDALRSVSVNVMGVQSTLISSKRIVPATTNFSRESGNTRSPMTALCTHFWLPAGYVKQRFDKFSPKGGCSEGLDESI